VQVKRKETTLTELINELSRTKSGLYNLKITTPDKRPVLVVSNITREKALELIEAEERKADGGGGK
jgi:hypothetical protein